MTYTLPNVTDAPIICLEGEIDPRAVISLQRRIVRALDTSPGQIVVDLTAVTGLGGPTLSLFCGALRFVGRCGARLAVAGGPAGVRRAVELCEIDGVGFYPTVNAALTAPSPNVPSVPDDNGHNRRVSATTKRLRQHA